MDHTDTQPPSTARQNACLKQLIRDAKCSHPERSLRILLLNDDGYVEYCTECMRVTSLWGAINETSPGLTGACCLRGCLLHSQ